MMPTQRRRITIGNVAGQSFSDGGLVVSRHATRTGNGTVERGFLVTRKWLADRDAFNADSSKGWAKEFWFEWE
jgi:hypothetical protein